MARKTFEEWMKEVDRETYALLGVSYKDLPDVPFYDWYENRVSPKTAAKRLKRAMFE